MTACATTGPGDLVLANKGLALYILKKCRQKWMAVRRLEAEDAVQAALLGLCEAARAYDPSRGGFAGFAAKCIISALTAASQTAGAVRVPWQRRKRPANLLAQFRAASVGQFDYDREPEPERPDEPAELLEPLRDALPRLSDRQRDVLNLRYRDGLTLAEAGERLGVTRERVRQIEAGALRELRGLLGITWEPRRNA